MFTRMLILFTVLSQISACMVVPPIEVAQKWNFDYIPQGHAPMSYDDLLCCYRCEA